MYFLETLTSNKKNARLQKKIVIGPFIRLHFLNLSIKSLEWDHQYWILVTKYVIKSNTATDPVTKLFL